MKNILFSFVVFLVVLCFNNSLNAQIIRMDDATASRIDQAIFSRMNGNNLTGLSVGIIYGGEIVFAKGYGVKNDDGDPFTHFTKSLLASVSKTITGVMAMKMVENGDFDLDDPIEDYILGFDDSGITIRHLLAHQSGIDHYKTCPDGYDGPFNWFSSNILVDDCSTCMTPPGSGSLYSTHGITLLGSIIEVLGIANYDKTFEELYEFWLKNPAGLTSLTPEFDNSASGLAEGFEENGDYIGDDFEDLGWRLPAGGFISNAVDLAKYAIAVMDNTFLTSSSNTQMFTNQTEAGGWNFTCNGGNANNGNNYGLSFRVSGSDSNLRASHNGLNTYGFSSLLYLYPNQEAGIVLLCNNYNQTDVLSLIRQDVENDILCPSTRDFTTDIDWTTARLFEAAQRIDCSSELYPVSNSQLFTIDGGAGVLLEPGFVVKSGRSFRAISEGCGGSVTPY